MPKPRGGAEHLRQIKNRSHREQEAGGSYYHPGKVFFAHVPELPVLERSNEQDRICQRFYGGYDQLD
jgi:hypothetical protein